MITNVEHLHVKTIDYTRSNDSRPICPSFVTNTKDGYLLVLRLTTIEAVTSETVLDEPPELLINFVQKI